MEGQPLCSSWEGSIGPFLVPHVCPQDLDQQGCRGSCEDSVPTHSVSARGPLRRVPGTGCVRFTEVKSQPKEEPYYEKKPILASSWHGSADRPRSMMQMAPPARFQSWRKVLPNQRTSSLPSQTGQGRWRRSDFPP